MGHERNLRGNSTQTHTQYIFPKIQYSIAGFLKVNEGKDAFALLVTVRLGPGDCAVSSSVAILLF